VQEPGTEAGPPLRFTRPLVVVGGGRVDQALLRELAGQGAHLVAADGGAQHILDAGLVPEAVIGDFDSVANPATLPPSTRLIRLSEQETTDFEKVLYSTAAPVTIALGMTGGGRFDHTLAALDAVRRHADERTIILVDEGDLALALTGPFAFTVAADERVSVHPLGPVTFARSEGLLYPLDGLLLAPGIRTGTSNVAVAGPFSITPEPGQAPWLLVLVKRYLLVLIRALWP
jgi:thiamine pyrophosphokinase